MGGFQGLPIPVWMKFTFCVAFDLFDMTFGRALVGVSIFTDLANALVMFLLWGPLGLLASWEAVEITEQIDGFIPTNTIVGWIAYKRSQRRGTA